MMEPTYASIDLETTGLNHERDAIMEIGIVRFRGDEILGKWSSLVNPGRRVPPSITELTGITQEEVDEAPKLLQVRHNLAQMVKGLTLIAHSAPFDRAFLHRNGLCRANAWLDTLELASILLPTAAQYSLSALTRSLEVPNPSAAPPHRALADALMTAGLFRSLQERAAMLPYETLEEIILAGRTVEWPAVTFFENALKSVSQRALTT
ncbi:MAG: hypothetical protein GQ526_04285, partial [Ardenticatenales bacterium]|nr:hypothetical protein [Ardenticatenales bacterium]